MKTTQKRAPGGGRKPLPTEEKLVRIELYLPARVASMLNAEELPDNERAGFSRSRKRAVAHTLADPSKGTGKFISELKKDVECPRA